MIRHRLKGLLATAVLSVGLSGAAVAVTALPAHATGTAGTDCSVSIDAPWHSPISNRVYFNSGIHCWGNVPLLIAFANEGTGTNGRMQVFTRWTCHNSTDCFSGGGSTFINYQGNGQYCGVLEGVVSSFFAPGGSSQKNYADKRCVWL